MKEFDALWFILSSVLKPLPDQPMPAGFQTSYYVSSGAFLIPHAYQIPQRHPNATYHWELFFPWLGSAAHHPWCPCLCQNSYSHVLDLGTACLCSDKPGFFNDLLKRLSQSQYGSPCKPSKTSSVRVVF